MSSMTYESVFIAAPNISEDAVEKLIGNFQEVINSHEGQLTTTDKWGRRKMAYPIKNFREGVYTLFEFEGNGDTVKELERRYRLTDSVIRYLTVRVDRKAKLVAKGNERKKIKEARKRSRVTTEKVYNED
ncbi:MAG: 30S ribosomal protein S6 [Acidobacteria bacterium]|nr:30S ribosomal protein S6 [Acidobacteriota bacterium]